VLAQDFLKKHLALSGKSPAYRHCRKNSKARAGKSAVGFFASPILKQLLDSSYTTLVPPYF
jgi:hypothetical protein